MADTKAEPKKALLSSKLMQLKFMQRAQEKKKRKDDTEEAAQRDTEAHWVLESAQSRCVVVAEGDPISSGTGRLSFNKFNPETEKLQQEAEERQQRAAAAAAGESEGKAVSDEAMAAALAKRQQQQGRSSKGGQQQQRANAEQDEILPLREPKRQRQR